MYVYMQKEAALPLAVWPAAIYAVYCYRQGPVLGQRVHIRESKLYPLVQETPLREVFPLGKGVRPETVWKESFISGTCMWTWTCSTEVAESKLYCKKNRLFYSQLVTKLVYQLYGPL